MSESERRPVRLLVCHAPEDEAFFEALERHLAVLRRRGRVKIKGSRLRLGDSVVKETGTLMEQADVVVLLVSAYFADSDRCWEQQLRPAIVRQGRGETVIVPVRVRAAFTEGAPFEAFHALPQGGEAIGEPDNDALWSRVATELARRIEGVLASGRDGLDSGEEGERDEADDRWSQDPPEWRFQAGRRALVERLRDGSDGFAYRVEKLCRLREKKELVRCQGRAPFAGVWEMADPTDPSVIEPIAALDGEPTEEAIRGLDELLDERYRDEDPGIRSRLIYRSARGGRAPESLVREARRRGIVLTPITALQRLIDFTAYVHRLRTRLENDAIYPQDLYIEQRGFHVAGRAGREVPNALDEVWSLVTDDRQPRFLIVLADFGTGKTFLLRQLAARLAEPKSDVVPILVELRALEKARSLNVLLAQHFTQAGENSYDLNAFYHMLEEGRIALLFDGFDELVPRVSFDRAAEHLETLIEAARGKAKVVITSRTQHFLTDKDVEMALARRAERVPHLQMFKLLPFSNEEIQNFLVRKLGSKEAARRRFALLGEVTDLLGLSHNPRMLSFIAEIEEEKLLTARDRTGHITKTELYTLLVQRWIGYEFERAEYKGVPTLFNPPERWRAVLVLAEKMWGTGDKGIDLKEIPEDLRDELVKLGPAEHDASVKVHHAASGTLLVRDEVGRFTFLHRSILEFAAAWAAARDMRAGKAESRLLGATDMTDLMAEFFGDLATPGKAAVWAQQTLSGEGTAAAKKNAQKVIYKLSNAIRGKLLPNRIIRRNEVIRGESFAGLDLRGADFSGSDLSEAVFTGANLEGANLSKAKLFRAELTNANLANTDLRGVDLRFARLTKADLRGAKLEGAVLRYARGIGAKVDSGVLDGAESGRVHVHVDVLGACRPISTYVDAFTLPASAGCSSVAVSPDGCLLAAGYKNGVIVLWAIGNGEPVRSWAAHERGSVCVAFSPDGQRLVSGSWDKSVRVWRVSDGAPLLGLDGHAGFVASVAFSPDGHLLASGGSDKSVRVWRVTTGEPLLCLEGYSSAVTSIAFSSDSQSLAAGRRDGSVLIWRASDGALLFSLEGHSSPVTSVAFSPDGQLVASGSRDRSIRIWSARTGSALFRLEEHSLPVLSVAFSPDSQFLASASWDSSVRLWRMSDGVPLRSFVGHSNAATSVAFSADGSWVASGSMDHSVRVWCMSDGSGLLCLKGRSEWVTSVAFSPDGQFLVSGSRDSFARVWRISDGSSLSSSGLDALGVWSVAFSPDGQSIALGCMNNTVQVWGVPDGATRFSLEAHAGWVMSVAFSPDGLSLASGSMDQTIRLWRVSDGASLFLLEGHSQEIMSVAFSPDGRFLASGSKDHSVRVWNVSNGTALHSLEGHSGWVTSVAVSPDGRLLASGSWDRSVRVWRMAEGGSLLSSLGHSSGVTSVAFSPNGQYLASGSANGSAQVWRVSDGALLFSLQAHSDGVASVAFSPDGRLLASASDDGTVRLWRVSDGCCVAILHSTRTGWVAYTADSRYKYAGDLQGTFWHAINLCRFEPGELDEHFPGLRMKDDEPLFTL